MAATLDTFTSAQNQEKRHLKINEITYCNNLESDYTEIIEQLDKKFQYDDEKHHAWGMPELSIFYGSELYEQASLSQKMALNHLFWATQYDHVAASETSTIFYNMVTAGVFDITGGYETLCKSLDLETQQEKYHVHAFKSISLKTKKALLGDALTKTGSHFFKNHVVNKPRKRSEIAQDTKFKTFRFLTNQLLKKQEDSYSPVLRKVEQEKHIPTMQNGYIGEALPRPILEYITYNWGSSPFMACQHYMWRYMGNASLKVWEYFYVKYYRELEKQAVEYIPAPTQISYFHLLDESFHTTTSQLIARDMYKDFPEPTSYEKLAANLIIYFMQRGILSHLSTAIPSLYRSDVKLYPFYYRILRSPVFDMSAEDALYWMEKLFCKEHNGIHFNLKMHHSLLTDLQRMASSIDYLWPMNREYALMAKGGDINKAIQENTKGFDEFRRSVIVEC